MKTKVIFRAWRTTGEVIALFPEIPHDRHGDFCTSYMHVGQHGAASPMLSGFARATRPATPEETAPLHRELESMGYNLVPVSRVSFAMHKARQDAARVLRAKLWGIFRKAVHNRLGDIPERLIDWKPTKEEAEAELIKLLIVSDIYYCRELLPNEYGEAWGVAEEQNHREALLSAFGPHGQG